MYHMSVPIHRTQYGNIRANRHTYVHKVAHNRFLHDQNNKSENKNDKEQNENNYSITLPGFDRITNPDVNHISFKAWILIFLVCVITCMKQCYECTDNYLKVRPVTNIEFDKRAHQWFPSFTICPDDMFVLRDHYWFGLVKRFKKLFPDKNATFPNLLLLPEMNLTTLWTQFKMEPERFTVTYGCSASKTELDCMDPPEVKVTITASGQCLSALIRNPTKTNGFLSWVKFSYFVKGEIMNLIAVRTFFHDYGDSPEYFNIHAGLSVRGMGLFRVAFTTTEIYRISIPGRPCDPNTSRVQKCHKSCIEGLLKKRMKCRLPFMKPGLADCKTVDEVDVSVQTTKEIFKTYANNCSCPEKCFETHYTGNGEVVVEATDTNLTCAIYFPNKEVRIIRENAWFTLSSLVSDIGGSLGFFLGFSVITMLETVEVGIKGIRKLRKRKQRQGQSKQSKSRVKEQKNENKEDVIPNFSINALDRILSRTNTKELKAFWWIILLLSIAFCSYLVGVIVWDYLYGEPAVKTEVHTNRSMLFPAFTFCPHPPYSYGPKVTAFRFDLAEEYNISIEEIQSIPLSDLFKLPDFNFTEMFEADALKKTFFETYGQCPNGDPKCLLSPLVPVPTILGGCLTQENRERLIYYGPGTRLTLKFMNSEPNDNSFAFSMFVHDNGEDPRYMNPSKKIDVGIGFPVVANVNLQKKVYLNRRKKPCENRQECMEECFEDKFEKELPCRLLFQKRKSKPLCSDSDNFNRSMTLAMEILHTVNATSCKCPRKCDDNIYTVLMDFPNGGLFGLKVTILVISYSSNTYLVAREYKQFTMSDIFANVFGSLGFVMGISILSLGEIVEYIVFAIVKYAYLDKKKQKLIQVKSCNA